MYFLDYHGHDDEGQFALLDDTFESDVGAFGGGGQRRLFTGIEWLVGGQLNLSVVLVQCLLVVLLGDWLVNLEDDFRDLLHLESLYHDADLFSELGGKYFVKESAL